MAFEDRLRMQVRFHDSTGRHLADLGGRGGGPGEFAGTFRMALRVAYFEAVAAR